MITHIVAIRWNDDLPVGHADAVGDALRAAVASLESVRSYTCGADAGLADGNADFGVVAVFDDVDGWRTYMDDAGHQHVIVEMMRPFIASRTALQIES